jgi:hypothetical protein
MTKNELMEIFNKCESINMGIRIELSMPKQVDPEIVINSYKSLNSKKVYYDKTFDENLIHKNNNSIRIIDARPIEIKKECKRITMWG